MSENGDQPKGHPPEVLRAVAHRAATQRWELLRVDLKATSNYEVTYGVVSAEGMWAVVEAATVMERENLHRIVTALHWQREYSALYQRMSSVLCEYAAMATGKDTLSDDLVKIIDRDVAWVLMPGTNDQPTEAERKRQVQYDR